MCRAGYGVTAMNNTAYIESRFSLLCQLCDETVAQNPNALDGYRREIEKLDGECDSMFRHIVEEFHLSTFEADVLFLGAAPSIDATFKSKIVALHQNFALSQVDVGLAIALFSQNFAQKIEFRASFLPDAKLIANHLCELAPRPGAESKLQELCITVPSRVMSHILGTETEFDFKGFSRILWSSTTLDQVMMPEKQRTQVMTLVNEYERCLALKKTWHFEEIGGGGQNIILLFSGPSGTGKTLMAQAIANSLKRPLLLVDAHELQANHALEDNLDLLFREARLQRAILLFDDCELIFSNRLQGNRDLPLLLAALDAYEGLVILTTNLPTELDPALDRRVTLHVDFEILPAKLRENIWRIHIPAQMTLNEDVNLHELADKYEFSGGTIRNSVVVAMNHALAQATLTGGPLVLDMTMLEAAAKTQIRNKIKKLADKTLTTLTLDDLVLPKKVKEQIRSLIASVRNRRTIFEEWGFGTKITKGRGICALFRGDSGTGKTLSAEIISNELGMTLYRVRIPAIISKYVGETEKNLERCFREAAASGALLLFDEADSIFSKRTEVKDSNDRYSNMEVNLLLQEVERFEGVVILTTNLDAAIDDAFERRLNHKIDFPFPEARSRSRIWKRLLPATAPLADDIDYETLGKDLELSGGNIKNAVIRAAYRAAEQDRLIDMELLEESGLQEYREMGKLVPNRQNPWDS